jgi:hypothetical protein
MSMYQESMEYIRKSCSVPAYGIVRDAMERLRPSIDDDPKAVEQRKMEMLELVSMYCTSLRTSRRSLGARLRDRAPLLEDSALSAELGALAETLLATPKPRRTYRFECIDSTTIN